MSTVTLSGYPMPSIERTVSRSQNVSLNKLIHLNTAVAPRSPDAQLAGQATITSCGRRARGDRAAQAWRCSMYRSTL